MSQEALGISYGVGAKPPLQLNLALLTDYLTGLHQGLSGYLEATDEAMRLAKFQRLLELHAALPDWIAFTKGVRAAHAALLKEQESRHAAA